MIQSHIKNLLYAYDCVIIPDFGGLITHYAPAKIHPVKHTFSPPSKHIAFNEQLNVNDGLLISTLAKQQQWPLTQAQQAVADFVQDLKQQLLEQHRFELQDVGVFRYSAERKLVFESIESDNFLEQSFGLPELVSKPIAGKESLILRGKYKDQTANPAKESKKPVGRFKRLYRVGTSLVIGGLTVSAFYLFSLQSPGALSSLNPFSLLAPTETAASTAESLHTETESETYGSYSEDYGLDEPEFAEETEAAAEIEEFATTTEPPVVAEEKASEMKEPVVAVEVPKPLKDEVAKPAKPIVAVPEAKKPAAPAPVKEAAAAPATGSTIKQKTGRFYVIMGVFTQDGYAERNQKQLQKKGYDAKIVQPTHDARRDRVSVADFATAQEAYAALPELRKKINNELWVFNY